MKYFLTLSLLVSVFVNIHAQNFEIAKDRTGSKMLKGFVTDSILKADSASFKWFTENEQSYMPSDEIVKSFARKKDSVNFMVFFGTWCSDSHYVIPRFYKIIEQSGVDKTRISLFALDRTKNDAAHFAANFNVTRVPTIIVLKNGKEAGRVVEHGASGQFDEELASIINRID